MSVRGNLDLWPTPSSHLASLAAADGQLYDEDALLSQFQGSSPEATNTRAVRNTFEVMAYAGLATRESGVFTLTPFGKAIFSFLGTGGSQRFANATNRPLLGRLVIRGLRIVPEYRAIWRLMILCDGRLSNEELNRALPLLATEADVPQAADLINAARLTGNVHSIGPRIYDLEKFGTGAESDQRKAINPQFLLAGGGKIFLDLDSPYRRLPDWAVEEIEIALATDRISGPLSTERRFASSISLASGAI